jgi:hypothetical protein
VRDHVWPGGRQAGLRKPLPRRARPGALCGARQPRLWRRPWDVQRELAEFEAKLQRTVAGLDAKYPTDASLDDDGMSAVIELAAWAHAEWVRIHPFANGNGRAARVWANLLLMRYGLPPVVTLRPRPGGRYGAAGAAAMTGDREPTVRLFRRLVRDAALNPPRSTAAGKKKPPKPTEPGK